MVVNTLISLITGLALLGVTAYRLRIISNQKEVIDYMKQQTLTSDVDTTGNTTYPNCISHNWVRESVIDGSSSIISWIRDIVDNHSILFSITFFAFLIFTFSMLITSFYVSSVMILGGQAGIFIIGAAILFGTSDARISEHLLRFLSHSERDRLSAMDYPYAKIAFRTVQRSLFTTGIIGTLFILLSPWTDFLIQLITQGLAGLSYVLVFNPALYISQYHFGIAFLYLVVVIPFLLYSVVKTGSSLSSKLLPSSLTLVRKTM